MATVAAGAEVIEVSGAVVSAPESGDGLGVGAEPLPGRDTNGLAEGVGEGFGKVSCDGFTSSTIADGISASSGVISSIIISPPVFSCAITVFAGNFTIILSCATTVFEGKEY